MARCTGIAAGGAAALSGKAFVGGTTLENGQEFVDYYALLQVNPTCDAKMLEKAYRHFAHMYHPDHSETGNVDKFHEINEAYSALRSPEMREKYDRIYHAYKGKGAEHVPDGDEVRIDEKSAIGDAEMHEKILFHLYKRRRERAEDPGVIGYTLQEMLKCTDENFEFHIWYLKSKGFLDKTEQGTLAITIEGVDHVISMSRAAEAERLLIAKSDSARE